MLSTTNEGERNGQSKKYKVEPNGIHAKGTAKRGEIEITPNDETTRKSIDGKNGGTA